MHEKKFCKHIFVTGRTNDRLAEQTKQLQSAFWHSGSRQLKQLSSSTVVASLQHRLKLHVKILIGGKAAILPTVCRLSP